MKACCVPSISPSVHTKKQIGLDVGVGEQRLLEGTTEHLTIMHNCCSNVAVLLVILCACVSAPVLSAAGW